MTVKLLTPRLGEGVEQVTVLNWLKKEGDLVKEYEPLVEVETDKVVTEIPSPADGVLLKIYIQPNAPAMVGQALAEIGGATEPATSPPPITVPAQKEPEGAPRKETPPVEPAHGEPAERVWVSPIVAKMLAEHNLDIRQIQGSGLGGRVTKQDVLDVLASRQAESPSPQPVPARIPSAQNLEPITPIRRRIAERMLHSVHTAPHVLTVMEADLSQVLSHLAAHKDRFARDGIRLTLTAYFIEALSRALRANPLVNASWTEEGILVHPHIHIGMAVSLGEAGLIVPVIKDADALSLLGIARAVNDLADRARAGKLQPDEVRGGTFSLTNHGTGGSLFATPIINQPQTGILGTGSLLKRAVVITDDYGRDAIAIRPMIFLSFVFDHRVLDGAAADKFLSAVRHNLERVQTS